MATTTLNIVMRMGGLTLTTLCGVWPLIPLRQQLACMATRLFCPADSVSFCSSLPYAFSMKPTEAVVLAGTNFPVISRSVDAGRLKTETVLVNASYLFIDHQEAP